MHLPFLSKWVWLLHKCYSFVDIITVSEIFALLCGPGELHKCKTWAQPVKKHDTNHQSSEWEQHLSTPRWGEWRNFCPPNWIFLHLIFYLLNAWKICILLYYMYFNISFFPWNHQIKVTLPAIRHEHTVTPSIPPHTLSGGHHCQLEKHNSRGTWYFQREVGEVSSLSTLIALWPVRVIFLQQNVWRVMPDDNSSHLLLEFWAKIIT